MAADTKNVDPAIHVKKELAAMKITSPKLRVQASANLRKQEQQALASGQVPQGGQPGIAATGARRELQGAEPDRHPGRPEAGVRQPESEELSRTSPDYSKVKNALTEDSRSRAPPPAPCRPTPRTTPRSPRRWQSAAEAAQRRPLRQQQWVANLEHGSVDSRHQHGHDRKAANRHSPKALRSLTTVVLGPDEQQVFNVYQTLLVNLAQAKQKPQCLSPSQRVQCHHPDTGQRCTERDVRLRRGCGD